MFVQYGTTSLSPMSQDKYQDNSTFGRWTESEHALFMEAYGRYGKDWKAISEYVKTRTLIQVRSHAQKYFVKLKRGKELYSTSASLPSRITAEGEVSDKPQEEDKLDQVVDISSLTKVQRCDLYSKAFLQLLQKREQLTKSGLGQGSIQQEMERLLEQDEIIRSLCTYMYRDTVIEEADKQQYTNWMKCSFLKHHTDISNSITERYTQQFIKAPLLKEIPFHLLHQETKDHQTNALEEEDLDAVRVLSSLRFMNSPQVKKESPYLPLSMITLSKDDIRMYMMMNAAKKKLPYNMGCNVKKLIPQETAISNQIMLQEQLYSIPCPPVAELYALDHPDHTMGYLIPANGNLMDVPHAILVPKEEKDSLVYEVHIPLSSKKQEKQEKQEKREKRERCEGGDEKRVTVHSTYSLRERALPPKEESHVMTRHQSTIT